MLVEKNLKKLLSNQLVEIQLLLLLLWYMNIMELLQQPSATRMEFWMPEALLERLTEILKFQEEKMQMDGDVEFMFMDIWNSLLEKAHQSLEMDMQN